MVDMRYLNLVKSQKRLKSCGKCQIYTAYIWIILNAISLLSNAFMLLLLNDVTEIPTNSFRGQTVYLKLGAGGVVLLSLLKIIVNGLFIKWGLDSLKIFKPLVKGIEREQGGDNSNFENHSATIGQHQKKVTKILLVTFILTAVSILYARSYGAKIANVYVDDMYNA